MNGRRSEGAVALARAATEEAIAKACEVSRTTAHNWRSGKKLPGPENRAKILATYSIASEAWDRLPIGPSVGVTDSVTPRSAARLPANARILALVEDIDHEIDRLRESSSARELAALFGQKRQALADVARLEPDETKLLGSEAWQRVRDAILEVLAEHPQVARAVEERLVALGEPVANRSC